MLGEVMTFLLGIILAGNASKGVFKFHTEKMTWMQARAVCSRDGGSLTSNYSQKDFIDLMTNITDPVWIGNYYSPWAWLLGCYSYTTPRDCIEFKANQMKECLNHCHKTNYFGLQNKKCLCFDSFQEIPLETSRKCKYECPGNRDERCGGKEAITIYMNDICYENSAMWQGTVSQTWRGKQCLPWANIEEVKRRDVQYFPDGNADNASNYCRNPIGLSNRPWCFFSETEWEDCDIPQCIKEAKDGMYSCMSFKKPAHRIFQFKQEECRNENFAICTNADGFSLNHIKGTWQNARRYSRRTTYFSTTTKCKSLAGPQIFRLSGEDVEDSHWFGFFREVCTDSNTVPVKMPTKCFSLSKEEEENNEPEVEECDNKNHFICQYMAVTCGDTFNNSLNGTFETPDYNNAGGYGDFQRCVWNIDVPESYKISLFLDISIEDTYKCNSDIIKVYEESYETGVSFCGESTETYNTTGNHVTVEFKSDGTENGFRGVYVKWSAVSASTLSPTSSNSKFTMTTEQFSTTTKQTTKVTTFQQFQSDRDSSSNTLTGGPLVGTIVGILIGLCFVLGLVLFWAKRRKPSKNKEKNSIKISENMPAIRSDRCNSGDSRPSSEIYHNADTECQHLEYSLPNYVDVREKAVLMNSDSVSYQKRNGKDGCERRSGGNSDVYNTLHETTENIHQNDTENVYHHFNDSAETYDHTTSLIGPSKAGDKVASDIQTYGHLVDLKESAYDVTSM